MTTKKQRYAVLCEATVTLEVVVMAASPEDAVQRAYATDLGKWEELSACGRTFERIDSVTERRKNGRAFSVEDDGRCVEVEDLPW
jgi:hypothetical protein